MLTSMHLCYYLMRCCAVRVLSVVFLSGIGGLPLNGARYTDGYYRTLVGTLPLRFRIQNDI